MAKATNKRKVQMPGGIKTKLTAAFCMLLVSAVMMVSATYAWFTLSTAPEVTDITTSAVGNGSLEIALMPESGLFSALNTGLASENHGGKTAVTTANTTWGNIVELNDTSYGLANVTLLPAVLDTTNIAKGSASLKIASYGKDGRVTTADASNAVLGPWVPTDTSGAFTVNDKYGVRAIGTAEDATASPVVLGDTYAYAVDLAFRTNVADSNLLLQTDAAQRVYDGSKNEATMGGGSTMTIISKAANLDINNLVKSIRVTFVQNYGNADTKAAVKVLGTAKLDAATTSGSTTTANLYLYDDTDTKLEDTNAVLTPLTKDAATQITAIVWLDGKDLTNADVGTGATSFTAQLNLQFASSVDLVPANNTSLYGATETASGTN